MRSPEGGFRMDENEVTSENVHQYLNEYAAAMRSEFEDKTKATPDNVEAYTTDFFKSNIHAAAAQIVFLATNSDSDSVKLRASQFIIERALTDGRADGDPIKDLLKKLTPAPAKQPAEINGDSNT